MEVFEGVNFYARLNGLTLDILGQIQLHLRNRSLLAKTQQRTTHFLKQSFFKGQLVFLKTFSSQILHFSFYRMLKFFVEF